jgi:signal transduction histidine kinase/CheY-like chemotaxis protein
MRNPMHPSGSGVSQTPVDLQPLTEPLASKLAPLRVLILLFISLPLLAYTLEGVHRYRHLHAESALNLSRTLKITQEHALKIFQTNEIILDRISDALGGDDNATLQKREKALYQQFHALSRDKEQTQSIWVWDDKGQPLASDRRYPVPRELNISDRSYFQWHQTRRSSFYLSERNVGRATGTPFIDMSRGRYRPDTSFAGVTSVSLSPTYFEDFHKELISEEPGMHITMLREDGAVLTQSPPLPNPSPRLMPDSPVMRFIHLGLPSGNAQLVASADEPERLFAYGKVGNYPVYISTSIDVNQITQRWMREMGWIAAFGLLPMLGLFLVARVALRRTREALYTAEKLKDETLNRKQVENALLQAQKMEALGRLTGGVAHDFNNALMVISTNLALLKRKHPAADDKQLQSIERAVETATKLTRQLLAFSHRQPLLPQCLNLHDWLGTAKDMLDPVLGRRVQLSAQIEEGTCAIYVDSAELELALLNLAINARDAMPSGGQLSITARNASSDELPPGLKGNMVVIEVSDTGKGIAPDILDKVFEPFFTTKPVGEGTGLGLSQMYGLCQRAGGLATVQSQVGKGTTFSLFFPVFHEQPGTPEKPPNLVLRNLALEVLLVEDNDEVAAVLIQVLEAMGCQVKHFDRALNAKDWLAHQAALPDLLLSDVVMPGQIDGIGLAKHVREKHPDLKIVLMSGYAEQLDTITRLGFDIIPKPCSPELLADTIERVLGKPCPANEEAAA